MRTLSITELLKINFYGVVITFFFYFTVYFAFYAQTGLAIIQIVSVFLLITAYYEKFTPKHKKLLFRYWAGMIISVSYYYAVIHHFETSNDFFLITSMFIVPMLVACYFVYTLDLISKEIKADYK
jgi:hypothetical protein